MEFSLQSILIKLKDFALAVIDTNIMRSAISAATYRVVILCGAEIVIAILYGIHLNPFKFLSLNNVNRFYSS